MKKNMGTLDRVLRIVAALAVIGLYFADMLPAAYAIPAMVVSGIFVLTGFISFCPLYTLFGINTCPVNK